METGETKEFEEVQDLRPPLLTWTMVMVSIWVFTQQWKPHLPLLQEGVRQMDFGVLWALLLASPDTPWRLVGGGGTQ